MRMNFRHNILIMCTAILMVMGCSKDDGDVPKNTAEQEQGRSEIRFNADVWKMMTRANIINDDDDLQEQDIKIDAYYHGTETEYLDGVKLHYDTNAWKFWDGSAQLHYYWPIEGSVYDHDADPGSSLDFVGY